MLDAGALRGSHQPPGRFPDPRGAHGGDAPIQEEGGGALDVAALGMDFLPDLEAADLEGVN